MTKFYSKNSILLLGVIINFIVIVTSLTAVYYFVDIANDKDMMMELHQLKQDILYANLALRNAAIAPDDITKHEELKKMLVTRASADRVYKTLSQATFLNPTQINNIKQFVLQG